MIDLAGSSSAVQASALVGIVLLEAFVLYVGYGALESVVAATLIRAIEDK